MYQRVWHHADQSVYTHNIIIIMECTAAMIGKLGDSQGSCMHEWFTLHDIYSIYHGMRIHFV